MTLMIIAGSFIAIVLLKSPDSSNNIPFWIMVSTTWIVTSLNEVKREMTRLREKK